MIVAVGGGSPIDSVKGIGLEISNRDSIKDYEGLDRSEEAMPPLIAVSPTVSTMATPITDSAALKDIELIGKYLRPAVANRQNLDARNQMA